MRSEIVSRAQENVTNRYELCLKAAKVTRCLHFASTNTQYAINDAFVHLAMPERVSVQALGERPQAVISLI